MNEDRQEKFNRLKSLSELMDYKFKGPYGIRFGLDPLLGLLPIFGDFVTTIISFYIIIEAALLGCSLPILLRMVFNVLVENVIDFIPLLGNLFDFVWKSNRKNMALLLKYETNPKRVERQSYAVIGLVFILLSASLALVIYGGFTAITLLYNLTLRTH